MPWKGPERRNSERYRRAQRLGAGALGVPAAVILSWLLVRNGVEVPEGVEAAIGAIVGAGAVCLEDMAGILDTLVRRRLRIKD